MSILTIHKSLDSDVLTRNEARELFSCCCLSYDDVSENDIYMLEAFVGCELSQFNELNELQMYVSHRKKELQKSTFAINRATLSNRPSCMSMAITSKDEKQSPSTATALSDSQAGLMTATFNRFYGLLLTG